MLEMEVGDQSCSKRDPNPTYLRPIQNVAHHMHAKTSVVNYF
jgi:hypothetical protein